MVKLTELKGKIIHQLSTEEIAAIVSDSRWLTFKKQVEKRNDAPDFHTQLKNFFSGIMMDAVEDEGAVIQYGTPVYAHNIGNNWSVPVKIVTKSDLYCMGFLHSTDDMYGGEIIFYCDNEGEKVRGNFTVRTR